MKVGKNGKITILEAISASSKTWSEIRKETGLSRPVISQHLQSLLADGLIVLPLGSGRGSKYEITPSGRLWLLQEEDREFHDEAAFFRAYDFESHLLERAPFYGVSRRVGDKIIRTKSYMKTVETPQELLEHEFPTFPLPIRAALRMSDNATLAIQSYLDREVRHQGINEDDKEEMENIYNEVAHHFADPNIRKFCEVLFERTRALSSLHCEGEKGVLPTLDNILNFNIEILCRYEGEKLLDTLSKEERVKAGHILAGTVLLYLGGSGTSPFGPAWTFVWEKKHLEALVTSGLLTKDEIQPLLEACKLVHFDHPPRRGRSAIQLHEDMLTVEQKRKITISAYRRFYLARGQDYDKIFADAVPEDIKGLKRKFIKIVEESDWKDSGAN